MARQGAGAAAANGQPSGGPALVRKPLGGVQGYQRLVRLLARAFYAGECPPREEDGPPPESMTEAQRLKAQRVRGEGGAARNGSNCMQQCVLRVRGTVTRQRSRPRSQLRRPQTAALCACNHLAG